MAEQQGVVYAKTAAEAMKLNVDMDNPTDREKLRPTVLDLVAGRIASSIRVARAFTYENQPENYGSAITHPPKFTCDQRATRVDRLRHLSLLEHAVEANLVVALNIPIEFTLHFLRRCESSYLFWAASFSNNSVDLSSSSIAWASFLTPR